MDINYFLRTIDLQAKKHLFISWNFAPWNKEHALKKIHKEVLAC